MLVFFIIIENKFYLIFLIKNVALVILKVLKSPNSIHVNKINVVS